MKILIDPLRRALAVAWVTLLACGPATEVTAGTDSLASASESEGSMSPTAGTGLTEGASAVTTDATAGVTTDATTDATTEGGASSTIGTSAGSTTRGTDTTDTEGDTDTSDLECMAPQAVELGFELTPALAELDESCLVLEEIIEEGSYSLALSCELSELTLTVTSSPPLSAPSGVEVGELIGLTYVTSDDGQWLTLKQVGEPFGSTTVVGMVSAATIDPPGTTLSEFFGAPEVELVDGQCEPHDDLCGPLERVGLLFSYFLNSPGDAIFDHDYGSFGIDFASHFEGVVERAGDLPTNACVDPRPKWFTFGFTWVFTGP
jgi:hypothetical protein